MASPAPSAPGPLRRPFFTKTRLVLLCALLALLALCLVFTWTTRGAMANFSFLRNQGGGGSLAGNKKTLVDLRPWQTAQALAPLAVSAEETEFAQEAQRLADHEVDQAFASALRMASLQAQHLVLTGEALRLSQRVTQLQQIIKQDQAQVDSLKAKAASSPNADDDDL